MKTHASFFKLRKPSRMRNDLSTGSPSIEDDERVIHVLFCNLPIAKPALSWCDAWMTKYCQNCAQHVVLVVTALEAMTDPNSHNINASSM